MSRISDTKNWPAIRLLMLSGISSLCLILPSEKAQADDFSGFLSNALDNSAAVSAYEERERGAEAAVDEARAAFLPNLCVHEQISLKSLLLQRANVYLTVQSLNTV